ncbi:hypothetical protein COT20_02070 [bacterium (Candidatus Gribaldobacteria) CG08_land_8_20_14_0_20_39_15]|uniref:Small ribosomal subunit protein bS6 n=1 Tax=bacterium (Candidatus Gribaldobacteria) CG08_land_8_20_14_0_20_39_15 TaxID=2014273 RepID=A0A2M6XUG5_9BACT|nr:MAG: hypothetical protein COT20_02070 [bacterium (Candidatus Gribaldobacteria) CG08_land_8_20_14_0_20_39_15]
MLKKLYELTCLLSPNFNDEQAIAFAQDIEAKIEKDKTIKMENPKKIGLSYPIKKQNAAFLFSMIFETEPEKAERIKKTLEKEEKILRFLLLNKKQIQEGPILNIPEKVIPSQANELKVKISAEEQPAPDKSAQEAKKETAPKKEKTEKKPPRKKKIGDEEKKADLKQIEEDLDKILEQ